MGELLAGAGVIIVLAFAVVYRWLSILQTRVNDHAERIAWLEARSNGHRDHVLARHEGEG